MRPRCLARAPVVAIAFAVMAIGTGLPALAQPTPAPPPAPAPVLPLPGGPQACESNSPIPACGPPAAPAPTPPAPGQPPPVLPLPSAPEACDPASPIMACHLPEPPLVSPPSRPAPITMQPEQECGLSNMPDCVTEAMAGFFTSLVVPGLNEALGLLGGTVLATPKLDEIPVMGHIWENSRQIVLVSYGLVVTIAGLVVLAYQTLQARASLKEVLPRIAVGFTAANLSLLLAGYAIDLANAFSLAILGGSLDPREIGQGMADTFIRDVDGGSLLVLLIAVVLVVMIVVVLLTYVVRVMLTIILIVAAPLLLMCHALPQTEPIAFWWWKAFAGTLVIQIGQSFALVAAIKMFFLPGGISLF